MAGFAPTGPAGLGEAATEEDGLGPGFAMGVFPGIGGLVTAGNATVAVEAPAGLGPTPAGLGGKEIRMVSLRKSDGGLAIPELAGAAGGAPGTEAAGAGGTEALCDPEIGRAHV